MFQVEYDPRTNVFGITVKGFWKLEEVPALAAAVGAQVRAASDDFNVLVESLDFSVQGNDVADLMTSIMRGGMAYTSGRAAIVVGSQLNKLQAERTLVHPRLRVFLTMNEARDWLAGT